MELPKHQLDAVVRNKLKKAYGSKQVQIDLFYWLWDELNNRLGRIGCKLTKRYVAIYTSTACKKIVCYVEFQSLASTIGIYQTYLKSFKTSINTFEFPDWNGSRRLMGFLLLKRETEILDLIEHCYQSRINER